MSVASFKTAGAYALVLVGVAALVVLSSLSFRPSRAGASSRSFSAANLAPGSPAGLAACSAQPASSSPVEPLRQAQIQARALLDGGNTGEAMTRLRSLAAADPGLPGVHLDLSTALLKAHQTDGARSAIDTQLNASECLSRLPSSALDAYCTTQMSQTTAAACRQELSALERSAHFQAALVQMELASAVKGGAATPALNAGSASLTQRSGSKPSPKLLAAAAPQRSPTKNPTARLKSALAPPTRGNPLAAGAGTDTALGAYSK